MNQLPRQQFWGDLRYYYFIMGLSRKHSVHLLIGAELANWTESDVRSLEAEIDGLEIIPIKPSPRSILEKVGRHLLSEIWPSIGLLWIDRNFKNIIQERVDKLKPDVIIATYGNMAAHCQGIKSVPVVVDLCDAWGLQSGLYPPGLKRWWWRRSIRKTEAFAASVAQRILIISERDARALNCPKDKIVVIPNGVDQDYYHPNTEPYIPHRVAFCGGMAYIPNVEGVTWFSREVWPQIRSAIPDAEFYIVGRDPMPPVRELDGINGIKVTGTVEDVRPYVWSSAFSVAPLITASGLQNKVIQSLAMGVPVVLTPAANGGIQGHECDGIIEAKDAESFATAVIDLMQDNARRATMAEHARQFVGNKFGWNKVIEALDAVLSQVVEFGK